MGRATTLAFAELGAKVCVTARTTEQVESVPRVRSARSGARPSPSAPTSAYADVERLFATAVDTFGQVDIMVNNAGSFPIGPISEFPEEEFDAAVRVDLKAAYLCSQSALNIGGMLGPRRRTDHQHRVGLGATPDPEYGRALCAQGCAARSVGVAASRGRGPRRAGAAAVPGHHQHRHGAVGRHASARARRRQVAEPRASVADLIVYVATPTAARRHR